MEQKRTSLANAIADRSIQLVAEGLAAKVAERITKELIDSGFEKAFASNLIQRLREDLGIKEGEEERK